MARKVHSIVDMVILGILIQEPMNAYRLAHFVEERQIMRLVKLSTPAIYKSCKRLYEQGNLEGELMREGEAPEKMLYTVTTKGVDRFKELMGHFAGDLSHFYFDINSVIFSLERVNYHDGLELIESYAAEVKTMKSWLIPHSKEPQANATFAARQIVKQYVMVVEVLDRWIIELREEYVAERG